MKKKYGQARENKILTHFLAKKDQFMLRIVRHNLAYLTLIFDSYVIFAT